jgi:hypothetical protein
LSHPPTGPVNPAGAGQPGRIEGVGLYQINDPAFARACVEPLLDTIRRASSAGLAAGG